MRLRQINYNQWRILQLICEKKVYEIAICDEEPTDFELQKIYETNEACPTN